MACGVGVCMSREVEEVVEKAIERIDLRMEEFIVDVFGSLRVWSEPEDYEGFNLEVVDGYRRLVARLDPVDAARLSMMLTRFLFRYLSAKLEYYYGSIEQVEKKLKELIEYLRKPEIVYAGNDEVAAMRVSASIKEFERLNRTFSNLVEKHDIVFDLHNKMFHIVNELEKIYKVLHII